MLCLGGAVSFYSVKCFQLYDSRYRDNRFLHHHVNHTPRWRRFMAIDSESSFAPSSSIDSDATAAAGFCIIEGPETVQDFAKMELQEIQDNIRSRRNKIFLHMEEVRRLRIQQRIKNAELGIFNEEQENELPNFPSFIPFLPPLTSANLRQYYATCFFSYCRNNSFWWSPCTQFGT
uniref:Uncharacterized protein n=1 Tax=Lotus japonicus TaxID=34305 RepID=I3T168_LOTJA|nr:unknown [Lotus japonicus]